MDSTKHLTIHCDPELEEQAQAWANQHLCSFKASDSPWQLYLSSQGWSLSDNLSSSAAPITLDFLSGTLGYRLSPKRTAQEPLLKTLGQLKKAPCRILDASAGFGVDALIFATQGHSVTACERHLAPYTLLYHALQAASQDLNMAPAIKNIALHHTDVKIQLPQMPAGFFDVIYFDPMYPLDKRKAKPNQKMLLNKQVVGSDDDADGYLSLFLQHAPKKIIIKRPKKAPYLNGEKPHQSLIFQSTRYDVYLPPTS